MSLSWRERERLEELERQTAAEDPEFAHGLAEGAPHSPLEYPDVDRPSPAVPLMIAGVAAASVAAALAARQVFAAVVGAVFFTAAVAVLIVRAVRVARARSVGRMGLAGHERDDGGPVPWRRGRGPGQ